MFVTPLLPPGLSSNWLTLVCTSCATRARRRGEVTSRWSLASGRLRNYSANRSHLLILTWSPLRIKESNTRYCICLFMCHDDNDGTLTGTYFHKKICATCSGCWSKFDGWQSERRHILILHNYPWGEKNECPRFCNHFGFCPDFVSADINPIVLQYYYMNTLRSWSAAALGVWQTITKTQGMS